MAESVVHYVLLDIEGTTTPISFVADELFPYIRRALPGFLEKNICKSEVQKLINETWKKEQQVTFFMLVNSNSDLGTKDAPRAELIASIVANVFQQMDADRKSTELKALQGCMWRDGYASAELTGIVFDDVPAALRRWQHCTPVGIYSSGSIEAQKLLFGHTTYGSLLSYLHYHFDTTTGPKLEAQSAAALKTKPNDILFVSDAYGEVVAAREAGCVRYALHLFQPLTRLAVRPGNKALPPEASQFQSVTSFNQLFDDPTLNFARPSPC